MWRVELTPLEFGVNSRWEHPDDWANLMRRIMRLESQPAVINLVLWNMCREDGGYLGLHSGKECDERLRQTDDAAMTRFTEGNTEHREVLTNLSLATGAAALSVHASVVPLVVAKSPRFWPAR